MKRISFNFEFELISLDESLEKRPKDSQDQIIRKFREHIKNRITSWTKDEKIELETDKFDTDDPLQNAGTLCNEMKYQIISEELREYVHKGFKVIGFDESQYTNMGTYGRLASFKFGECQLTFKNGRYDKRLIMYKPIQAYIEDNVHKLIIYKDVITNFLNTLKKEFYIGSLKYNIDLIENWFQKTYKKKIDEYIKAHNYYYPSIGHVIDRIRTADEIIKTLIRIRDESNWGENEEVIFLGDGIHMFRQHIFPPVSFTNFFYNFIQTYNIKYYSFSKQSRLRDAQGNFILLYWDDQIKKDSFIVELPDIPKYTKSWTYMIRLIKDSPALRFDVPDFLSTQQAIKILRNLIPYSPRGYPLCLIGAHEASSLLAIEKTNFESKFMELQYDPETKKYMSVRRHKVIPY